MCIATFRATGATENEAGNFNAVPDDTNATMVTSRSERMNRTFKAVKIMADMISPNLERFVVIVSTNFTLWHDGSLVGI